MEARPTTRMKKGYLCRTSYDEKNQEIEPVMMIQQRCSRTRDDPDRVMILIQWWWSRSSDDPDPVMIQIQWWWSRSSDNPDPDDIEKKTCTNKLCRENTFLVNRECWCNCNFKMYSLVYLMYCTPMIIFESVWFMSCLDDPIKSFYNVNKSCQVIVGNPPIDQGLKSP